MTDPLPLLEALIRCPSVTPAEGGALGSIESVLAPLGFICRRLKFGAVENLFARFGEGWPQFCFAGHTDVVPIGDERSWTYPPFAAVIADGAIYGRGACDMKGSVAAFMAAALDYTREAGEALQGSVSLLITGDEEGQAVDGTVKVLSWLRENGGLPDHCLVGEPSCRERLGDTMKIGRRGSLGFVVTCRGRSGHVAYPHKADNPVPKLARLVDRLSSATLDPGSEHFDPSTLAVTTFDVGNPTTNVIPEQAMVRFNIRYNDRHTARSLIEWVKGEIGRVESELGGNFSFETRPTGDVFLTKPGPLVDIVREAVEAETGVEPVLSTGGGTSDARFIKDYCPVVEFGPTNATIHQVNECIRVDELRALARIYRRVLAIYFKRVGA